MANQTLANLRIATFSLLAFAGFLRFDDAIQLWACDLQIKSDMVKIAIHSSKTDQFRQGSNILITRTNSDTYPVAMLEWYMADGEINQTSELCLFIGLAKTKDDKKLCPSGSVYCSTMRDLFRKKLEIQQMDLEYTALGPVELQLLLRKVYQTVFSNNIGDGSLTQQR